MVRLALRAAVIGAVLLLSGCASEEHFLKSLLSWQGATLDDFVQAWGVPTRSYDLSGARKVIEWDRSTQVSRVPIVELDNKYVTSRAGTHRVAGVVYGTRTIGAVWCTIRATVSGVTGRDIIEDLSYGGNTCRSAPE